MRAILSITILLTMICYNIKTRPCYVDKVKYADRVIMFFLTYTCQINFFRTASFTCILWTSALVAILSDTDAAQSLGPFAVIYIIIGGWVFIILVFIIIYFIYYIQPPDHIMMDDSATAISPTQSSENLDYADHRSIRSAVTTRQDSGGWLENSGISKWWYGTSNNNDRTYYQRCKFYYSIVNINKEEIQVYFM